MDVNEYYAKCGCDEQMSRDGVWAGVFTTTRCRDAPAKPSAWIGMRLRFDWRFVLGPNHRANGLFVGETQFLRYLI